MAGWSKTTESDIVASVKHIPTGQTAGAALGSDWEMLLGYTDLGESTPTTTPADIDYGSATAVESNETVGAPNRFPNVRYIGFPVDNTATVLRFSGTLVNASTSAEIWFTVTDSPIARVASSLGAIHIDRTNARIGFWWGASGTTYTAYAGFISPGTNTFRCGIELAADGTANGYYYGYGAAETTSAQVVNDSHLVLIASASRTPALGTTLWPGCQLEFGPEAMSEVFIERGPYPGPGDVPGGFPSFFNPYGLYKSQLHLWGMLNNARVMP